MAPPARQSLFQAGVLCALGLAVGTLASLAAIGFVEAIERLNALLLIAPHARIQHEDSPDLVRAATVLVPAAGGLAVGLIARYGIVERRALGPPDAILAVQTGGAPPSIRSGLASTLAAMVSLGAGASVGQYGPLVYLGSLIGQAMSRFRLGLPEVRSVAIACGVAAAISTAFNAPIAGIVFAHEVVLRHYALRAFAAITVASAVGHVLASVVFGLPPLFLVRFDGVEHGYEFALFAGVGFLGALIAVAFMRLLGTSARLAGRLPGPSFLRPCLAGLLLGLVALELPEVLGIGKEALRFATIAGAFSMGELGTLVLAKILMTAMCVGFGFVGGVFSPALLIGTLFGAFVGLGLEMAAPGQISGLPVYAICGMTAVFSPVIGAPLTAILIVFELTRSYDLTIAAMVAVVFSNLTATRLFGGSLFDRQLAGRGFDLALGRDRAILMNRRVLDLAEGDVPRVDPAEPLGGALARLAAAGRSEAPAVDASGRFHGILRADAGRDRGTDARVADVLTAAALIFDETTSIWQALERLRGFVGEIAVVVDGEDGRYLGAVSEGTVISAYLETVQRLRREEHASI